MTTSERLFGYQHAFDHPFTWWLTIGTVAILLVAIGLTIVLGRLGVIGGTLHRELTLRIRSWCVLAPAMVIPVLMGAAWMMASVCALSLVCYAEFGRATSMFKHRVIATVGIVGILLLGFAIVDHWYGFFVALPALTISLMAGAAVLRDHPDGYVQRVALTTIAFVFFGVGLGHLGYLGNDSAYRPMVLLIVAGVQINDVLAFMSGKLIGRRPLAPRTSPNKTIGGAVGAVVLTTALVTLVGPVVFDGRMAGLWQSAGLGLIISVGGILGDLMMSSVKRDLGIKDMGNTIPGHGGFLDRFDSLVLVAPASFHFIGFFNGVGLSDAPRIITGVN